MAEDYARIREAAVTPLTLWLLYLLACACCCVLMAEN